MLVLKNEKTVDFKFKSNYLVAISTFFDKEKKKVNTIAETSVTMMK